ncbi:MAG: C10 family peptidase, partial [Bacteroidales bacterium]|nr:C10 family peptidase [Bacteroidales bacterium]
CVHTEQADNEAVFYIFNGDDAFVVVSAESGCEAVLAYSLNHAFDSENTAPAMEMWLQSYKRQIIAARQNGKAATQRTATRQSGVSAEVKPLLFSHWDQGTPYNYFCPKDDKGKNERCVTGCVATAMAQLMYYFRWPESGTGSYSYTHDTYGSLSADFGNSRYPFAHMCDQPGQINSAASLLTHHCGVAVDMVYGPGSSGMYNHKAAYALRTYFKYLPETRYIFRDSNGMAHDSLHPEPYPLNWDSVIIAHLERRIPLYYAGWSKPWTNGHGFVCDGYQKDSSGNCYFHFNFGWSGHSDGYFLTGSLFPPGYNFNLAQEIIINAYPDTLHYSYPEEAALHGERTLTHRSGSFANGYGTHGRCAAAVDHTWHIRPDLDSVVRMKIQVHCHLEAGDSLIVSSPDPDFQTLVLQATDTSFAWETSVTQWDVQLRTQDTTRSEGVHFSYEAVYPEFCTVIQTSTKVSATLNDGSGAYRYNPNTCCRHVINVRGHEGLALRFHLLETEKDKDVLHFYDLNDNNRELLRLSGQLESDSVFFLPSNVVLVEFESDDSLESDGWSFTYTGSKTALAETAAAKLSIRPNPANDFVRISKEGAALGEIRLLDISGRCLRTFHTEETSFDLSVNSLPVGMYLIRTTGTDGTHTSKLIKK